MVNSIRRDTIQGSSDASNSQTRINGTNREAEIGTGIRDTEAD